jgi:hypothetical protein
MKSEAQVDANRAGAPKCVPLNGFAKVEGVRAIREIQDADAHRHLGPTAIVECLRRREIKDRVRSTRRRRGWDGCSTYS